MKSRKSFVLIATMLGLALCAPRFVRGEDDRTAFDKRFVKEASEWSMSMVNVGRLAKDHSNSEGVKHYAEKVIDGDKKLMDELAEIAKRHDYHLADDMTVKQRETKRRLESLRDTDFDVEYMSDQREDQAAMVDLFEQARKQCVDENLRSFADRKLPALKDFRDNAEELYKKVKEKKRP